ncbi:MAG: four helix bundle protein [Endomicrobiia bacterium]
MKIERVEDLIVYQKAMQLFDDFINEDMETLGKHYVGRELGKQLAKSLDSICANMEEGFGRKAGKELKHYFRISRGSARESKGRYERCKKFLGQHTVDRRFKQLDEILAMLSSLISKLTDY